MIFELATNLHKYIIEIFKSDVSYINVYIDRYRRNIEHCVVAYF